MDTGEYLPNSNKVKEETPKPPIAEKPKRVIEGNVTVKKRSEVGRIAERLISEDVGNVKNHMVNNILIPAAKRAVSDTVATISDMVTSGVNTLLFGEAGRNLSNRGSSSRNTQYGSYWSGVQVRGGAQEPRIMDPRAPLPPRGITGYQYNDLIFETKWEAEDVLSQLDEIVSQFGMVSVADLYEIVKLKSVHTDLKYGWTNLSTASTPRNGNNGYILKLPRALPFD